MERLAHDDGSLSVGSIGVSSRSRRRRLEGRLALRSLVGGAGVDSVVAPK
jgi:hypothetical protein